MPRIKLRPKLLASLTLLVGTPSFADSYDTATRLLAAGRTDEAVKKFERSERAEAAYWLGVLAERGDVANCDRLCAARWYAKSADAGYHNAIPSLAVMYWNSGNTAAALEIFKTGARWNEPASRDFLASNGYNVPEPDLWTAEAERLQAEEQKRQSTLAERQKQQALLTNLIGSFLVGYYSGPGTVASNRSVSEATAPSAPVAASSKRQSTRMCPDGSFIHGSNCRLAPDGTYVAGPPKLAPDGSYVGGDPKLAPNGNYVGSTDGKTTLCPDGSYVGGARCILTPAGTYIGAP